MRAYLQKTGITGGGGALFALAFLLNSLATVIFVWVLATSEALRSSGPGGYGSISFIFAPAVLPVVLGLVPLLRGASVPRWLRAFAFIGAGWALALLTASVLGG